MEKKFDPQLFKTLWRKKFDSQLFRTDDQEFIWETSSRVKKFDYQVEILVWEAFDIKLWTLLFDTKSVVLMSDRKLKKSTLDASERRKQR